MQLVIVPHIATLNVFVMSLQDDIDVCVDTAFDKYTKRLKRI